MQILWVLLSVIITLVVYNLLKIFVLDKLNLNKWLILAIGVVLILLPAFLPIPKEEPWIYFYSSIGVIPFLWFFNNIMYKKEVKRKQIKIKPKAKPNRVKNIRK